jgi:hypothetical protein
VGLVGWFVCVGGGPGRVDGMCSVQSLDHSWVCCAEQVLLSVLAAFAQASRVDKGRSCLDSLQQMGYREYSRCAKCGFGFAILYVCGGVCWQGNGMCTVQSREVQLGVLSVPFALAVRCCKFAACCRDVLTAASHNINVQTTLCACRYLAFDFAF